MSVLRNGIGEIPYGHCSNIAVSAVVIFNNRVHEAVVGLISGGFNNFKVDISGNVSFEPPSSKRILDIRSRLGVDVIKGAKASHDGGKSLRSPNDVSSRGKGGRGGKNRAKERPARPALLNGGLGEDLLWFLSNDDVEFGPDVFMIRESIGFSKDLRSH